ncbi:hypothetical protein Btru_075131 [Bulinus truncatus]|nr:hypothetical protein Btru_075131 [Bulinus truncatus]
MLLVAFNSYKNRDEDANETRTDQNQDALQEAERLLLQVYPPFLLVVGITGNMVTIIILRSKSLRHNFVALFLTYLAACNILNLCIGLTRLWIIGLINSDIRNYSSLACNTHLILTMVFHVIANWLMTAVTACKLLYVQNPNRATVCCSKAFVHAVVITMSLFFIGFELMLSEKHYISVVESPSGRLKLCDFSRKTVYHALQVCVFYVVPGGLIILMNLGILCKVQSFSRTTEHKSPTIIKKERIVKILAAILFACDIQILVNELPYAVQHMFGPSLFEDSPDGLKKFTLLYHVASLLLYTNCSINFVIYCFFGDHFREELRRIFRPCLLYLCHQHSRWVESTADEDETYEVVRPDTPRRLRITDSSDMNTKLSLLNLFDSSFTEAHRNSTSKDKHVAFQATITDTYVVSKVQETFKAVFKNASTEV